jgi:hypothetical protein
MMPVVAGDRFGNFFGGKLAVISGVQYIRCGVCGCVHKILLNAAGRYAGWLLRNVSYIPSL